MSSLQFPRLTLGYRVDIAKFLLKDPVIEYHSKSIWEILEKSGLILVIVYLHMKTMSQYSLKLFFFL